MQIKQNALSVAINTHTGDVILRYTFPIKPRYIEQFKQVAEAYNIPYYSETTDDIESSM